MLTFLNSVIFTLLFAALIPLLIHLFNRQRRIKKSFSSLRFLKILEKQRLNRINIYQYLLIIIRTLIILLLIVAFARPALISDMLPGEASARSTAVIILDSGINMRYYDDQGMRFERAVAKLKEVLALYNPDDQVFVLLTHRAKKTSIDSLNIDDMPCSFIPGNWDNVSAETARILARYPNFNQEVIIISDNMTEHGQFAPLQEQFPNARQFVIQIGDRSYQNISIDSLYFVNELFEPLQPVELRVVVHNAGRNPANDTELHLYVADKRESYARIALPPGGQKTVALSFQPKSFGFIRGYVEISDDALDADNRYYFNLQIPEEVEVLFVEQNASLFLQSAFKTIDRNSNVNIKFARYEQWGAENFNKYHKIFLADFTALEERMLARLNNYLQAGGRLILMPGYNSTPNDINHLLKEIKSAVRVVNLAEVADRDSYFKLNIPARGNPVIGNLLRSSDTKIESPHFLRYFQVRAGSGVRSLLRFANRDPFLLYEKNKSGFIYLFSSYIDEAWTDIQFKGIFVPLFTRILSSDNYGLDQGMNELKVGRRFELILSPDQRTGFYTLETPENVQIKLIPEARAMTQVLTIDYLDRPGNYRVATAGRTTAILSANIPARDPARQPTGAESPAQILPTVFGEDDAFMAVISGARSGRELWKIFIILVILFIISELFIIKRIEK